MWLYLTQWFSRQQDKAQNMWGLLIHIYRIIRQNGLGICLQRTKQVITYQIGKNLVEMHHRYYIIHYPYGVRWYKIIVPRNRHPCLIDTIEDENGDDVKADVMSYMGPSHNFHGQEVTPKKLGYKYLIFTYIDETGVVFGADDTLIGNTQLEGSPIPPRQTVDSTTIEESE